MSDAPATAGPELPPDPAPDERPSAHLRSRTEVGRESAYPGESGAPAGASGSGVGEIALRVAGTLVAVLAAFFSGVLEVLFASLRVSGHLIGVSALVAPLANVAIAWFAVRTVGRRWALGPPWVVWTVVMLFAAGAHTTEGDYLFAGDNWVALVMILTGSLGYAGYAYRAILNRPLPR